MAKMKLTIPTSPLDNSGAVTERQYITEGEGFTLMFEMPFKRGDVYKELISEKQLGVDHSNIRITVHPSTDNAQQQLEHEIDKNASADEVADIKTWLANAMKASPLHVGCERTVSFPDGNIVSKLIELTAPSTIKWRQLQSSRETNMIGKPGGSLPEVTISLEDNSHSTSVKMTYDFYQILNKDDTVLTGDAMANLLAQATAGWSADMKRRGYKPIESPFSATGTPRGPATLRSARTMKSDLDEEAAMKAAMMEKAKASMNK